MRHGGAGDLATGFIGEQPPGGFQDVVPDEGVARPLAAAAVPANPMRVERAGRIDGPLGHAVELSRRRIAERGGAVDEEPPVAVRLDRTFGEAMARLVFGGGMIALRAAPTLTGAGLTARDAGAWVVVSPNSHTPCFAGRHRTSRAS